MAAIGSPVRREEVQPRQLLDLDVEENPSRKSGRKNNAKDKKPGKEYSSVHEKGQLEQKQLKKSKHRKGGKPRNLVKDAHSKGSIKIAHRTENNQKPMRNFKQSEPVHNVLRKRVDPETAKYFTEIANLFEHDMVDLEEHSTICGNALEETRGKELELATDMVISHTLQKLLERCDLDHLCGFLLNCAEVFPVIATDKFGSHVAEAALKSLATHLQDEGSHSYVEGMLNKICKAVVADAVKVMCSRYGSHVLRSLLCLCKGVPLECLEEFHVTKTSAILAERLNLRPDQSVGPNPQNLEHGFADTFKFLVREMLNSSEIMALRIDKYSSFVLQTVLKLSAGDDQELLHAISILLGCNEDTVRQDDLVYSRINEEIMGLLEDSASSHLLEVIIQVAPEEQYELLLTGVFKGSLFAISSHHYGNFVAQALISSSRTRDQMNLIWEELGGQFKELLKHGKLGVVASILAACQRLQGNRQECCQALAAAVSSNSESPGDIVPHMLYLESFFSDQTSWGWPVDEKMSVLGCLMLQTVFRYPNQYILPYIASMTSLDEIQIFQTAKDSGGSRVIEAFLGSGTSAKLKLKVIAKLQGRYGELAMKPSSSFTIEKCFSASNISLKEVMAGELLALRAELSKTKHGLVLLKKLDVDGYARWPEQWKSRQASKETSYREFQAAFGFISKLDGQSFQEPESDQRSLNKKRKWSKAVSNNMLPVTSEVPAPETSMGKLGFVRSKQSRRGKKAAIVSADTEESGSMKFIRNSTSSSFVRALGKKEFSANELADLAGKPALSAGDVRKLFKPKTKSESWSSVPRPFISKKQRR